MSEFTELQIASTHGYEIPVLSSADAGSREILLCLHGFAGGKRSPVIAGVAGAVKGDGIGVVTFDWPAHGESPAPDGALTVRNCLEDLSTIYAAVRERGLPVSCFATSFGGYLATLWRGERPDAFRKLILRSPALKMAEVYGRFLTDAQKTALARGEAVTVGFERRMTLGPAFCEGLRQHDAFSPAAPSPEDILILQGDRDDVVLPQDTAAYAERNGIRVEWFRGSDHRYRQDGDRERIAQTARAFLLGREA